MQIVIDIPEDVIECAKSSPNYYPTFHFEKIWRAIVNGIPLPEGYGRLFDEKDLVNGNYEIIGNKIYELEPIIEVDKE